MSWKEIKFADFLKERKGLLEPNNTNLFNYKKIDKIDFAKGNLFLTEYTPTKTKQIIVYPNDFIFSGLNIEKGAVTINTTGEQLVVSANYSTCEVDYSIIDMDFFLLFMKSLSFKNLLKENLKKDYGFTRPKHLEQIKFFIPSTLEEQRNLVKLANKNTQIVDEISTEINHQTNYIKKLRQQILQDAVQGKLVPQNKSDEPASELLKKIKAEKAKLIAEKKLKKEKDLPPIKREEIPFEIPENWVWCRGEIVASYIDPQPSHRTPPESKDGIPYIAMSDIRKDGSLDFNSSRKVSTATLLEHQNRYKLKEGDFIFGKIGTIGKPVKLPSPFNYTLSANVILIQPERKIVNQDYLFYFLSSPAAERNLLENKSTMSYPVFGMGKARNMPIPLPPLSEQNRIVQKIDEIMKYCNQLETSIKESEIQNEKILQQVLREALRRDKATL
jgi:restriction endonuclease S subunit